MKIRNFSLRTWKEIMRDPLNFAFGLGFPLVLLLLLTVIQSNVPVSLFALDRLTPGLSVFGLAFMSLFSATLVAKDRESAFLTRLYTTPMRAADFILGYTLPLLPMALLQSVICYLAAALLGLPLTVYTAAALLMLTPAAALFIAIGLLCGSVLNVRQVGGICGALLTNLTAWLSGVWFDLSLVGGAFEKIACALPFFHAVQMEQAALRGDFSGMMPHLYYVLFYLALTAAAATLLFLRQMREK